MKTYVLYHGGGCLDGFGAAWAAWRALGQDATYLPVCHGDPPPEMDAEAIVYVLDFSYPRPVLEAMAARHNLLVLDHHASAEKELAGLPYARFDLEKSGAVLAWGHFHPEEPLPKLLAHVQDRDLWRFAYPETRQVTAALASHPFDFEGWSDFSDALENDSRRGFILSAGQAILRAEKQQVEKLCGNAYEAKWSLIGATPNTPRVYRVVACNCPTFLASEVGHALLNDARWADCAFALLYSDVRDKRVYNLRGRGDIDLSVIAKSAGGGGHPNASGFQERHHNRGCWLEAEDEE